MKKDFDMARDKVYVSRFKLPAAEADFVCALGKLLHLGPDLALAFIVHEFAMLNPDLKKSLFTLARLDGRGPWK